MGLPSNSQPMNPGLNFATINAETLDEASREMEFKVPEDKVIDKVRSNQQDCTPLGIALHRERRRMKSTGIATAF